MPNFTPVGRKTGETRLDFAKRILALSTQGLFDGPPAHQVAAAKRELKRELNR